MIAYMLQRTEDLKHSPNSRATGSHTEGIGSTGNTAHLNLRTPLKPIERSFIHVVPRKS